MVKKKYSLKVVGTRLVREKTLYSPKPVTDPEVAIEVICDFLHDFDRETFGIICLSTKGEVNHISIVSIGNLNSALVSPREVFKVAILSNANSVILFHNHPSGKCLPSDEGFARQAKSLESLLWIILLWEDQRGIIVFGKTMNPV